MRPLTQLGDVYLIALIEIPQACSLKFLTCEQRSEEPIRTPISRGTAPLSTGTAKTGRRCVCARRQEVRLPEASS
jgi:hypothetical protein